MKKTNFSISAISGRLLQKATASIVVVVTLFMFVCIALSACDDDLLTSESKGKQASEEFCKCMEKNTLSKCEDELNIKYSSYTNNSDFINAFNDVNNCNITISIKK